MPYPDVRFRLRAPVAPPPPPASWRGPRSAMLDDPFNQRPDVALSGFGVFLTLAAVGSVAGAGVALWAAYQIGHAALAYATACAS